MDRLPQDTGWFKIQLISCVHEKGKFLKTTTLVPSRVPRLRWHGQVSKKLRFWLTEHLSAPNPADAAWLPNHWGAVQMPEKKSPRTLTDVYHQTASQNTTTSWLHQELPARVFSAHCAHSPLRDIPARTLLSHNAFQPHQVKMQKHKYSRRNPSIEIPTPSLYLHQSSNGGSSEGAHLQSVHEEDVWLWPSQAAYHLSSYHSNVFRRLERS